MTEETRTRILILERSPEIGELLLRTLRDAEYEVDLVVGVEDAVSRASEYRPNVLLLDLAAGSEEQASYRTLDLLRADAQTRAVPVVVLTTSSVLAAGARASFNVAATLLKPFDLDELLTSVRSAIHLAELHQPITERPAALGTLAFAEQVLAEHSREAIFRWVQRLSDLEPWKDRDDLALSALLDDLPVLVHALHSRLHYGSVEAFLDANAEMREGIGKHAATRKRQGIEIPAVIREYAILREELARVLRLHLPSHLPTAAVFDVMEAIDAMLDRVIEGTAHAYANGE